MPSAAVSTFSGDNPAASLTGSRQQTGSSATLKEGACQPLRGPPASQLPRAGSLPPMSLSAFLLLTHWFLLRR